MKKKLPILIACLGILSGCDENQSKDRVQVSAYTGFLSTRRTDPVQNDIYNYVDDLDGKWIGKIVQEDPLSFIFPAAYYCSGKSIKGGAVYSMDICIDLDTFGPTSLNGPPWTNFNSNDKNIVDEASRRLIQVMVKSNKDMNYANNISYNGRILELYPSLVSMLTLQEFQIYTENRADRDNKESIYKKYI